MNDEIRMTNDKTKIGAARAPGMGVFCFGIGISSFVIASLFEISLFVISTREGVVGR
jgi:hypothetical protein